jgi:YrbI family 3-deoxy-D-manno-octulosonate 8-phosphate phosphatase
MLKKSNFQTTMAAKSIHLPEKVQAIFFDFDGVFTDNRVIVSEDGTESVICNRSDGLGLSELKKKGVQLFVISTEINPVVLKRCEKIGIPCFQSINDKKEFLSHWLNESNIGAGNVIYVGNDINDNDCMQYVGCGVAVNDAHEDTKKVAKIILKNRGGNGAVRELCDLVLDRISGA